MEQLNSVTLRGIIGNARIQNIGDTHQVTAFKSDRMPDFSALVKGAGVEVKGRLRNNRFTDSNGVERTVTEILASQVSVIGGTLQ